MSRAKTPDSCQKSVIPTCGDILLSPIGRGKTPAFRRQLEQILCRLWGMSDYRHGSHTTFSIHLHIVWITKYRHKVLRGEVAERVRAIVREECQKARVDILKGHISSGGCFTGVDLLPW